MHKKRIAISLCISLLVEFINKVSPLFVLYLAKTRLGLERFGYSQFAVNLLETAIAFVMFGYVIIASKEVVNLQEKPKELGSMLSSLVVLKLIHALLTIAGLALLCISVPQYEIYFKLVMILSFILLATAFEMTSVLIAHQKIHLVNACLGFTKIVSLLAIYKLVNNSEDANLYAILSLGTNSVVSIFTFYIGSKLVRLHKPSLFWMKQLFRKGCHFALIYIGLNLLDRFDVFLAEWFYGVKGAALYVGPARVSQSLNSVVIASSLVLLSELVALKDKDQITEHVSLSMIGASFFLMPICFGVWFVDKTVISLIFGEEYIEHAKLLSFLVLAVAAHSIITILGFQVLALKDQIRKFTVSLLIGFGVGIASALLLLNHYQLYGIAVGVVLAKIVAAIGVAREARKSLSEIPWKWILRPVYAGTLMMLVLAAAQLSFALYIILLGAAVYVGTLCFLCRSEIRRLMKR